MPQLDHTQVRNLATFMERLETLANDFHVMLSGAVNVTVQAGTKYSLVMVPEVEPHPRDEGDWKNHVSVVLES